MRSFENGLDRRHRKNGLHMSNCALFESIQISGLIGRAGEQKPGNLRQTPGSAGRSRTGARMGQGSPARPPPPQSGPEETAAARAPASSAAPTPTSQHKASRVNRGVTCGQAGIGVVARLVVVVLDVQAGQLRVLDAQRAARVVNVLAVQLLESQGNSMFDKQQTETKSHDNGKRDGQWAYPGNKNALPWDVWFQRYRVVHK